MPYTAELSLQVDNLPDVLRKAEELVKAAGGYVQESGDNGGILRIPVEKADEVLRKIEAFGTVGSRRIVGTDVTDTVVDAEIRLNNLKTLRTRLLALLEKSDKVEDTLKIEQELNRVVTEIERYEGRLALLNNRISYVTLTRRRSSSCRSCRCRGSPRSARRENSPPPTAGKICRSTSTCRRTSQFSPHPVSAIRNSFTP